MKRVLTRILAVIAVLLIVFYLGDYLSLQYQIPGNRDQFGTVTVEILLAVPQKDGKTEFISGDTQNVQCVHSVFPHFGCAPCWYISRKKFKQINM
ncbi:MAG TPA: hypothetical protein VI756_19405 [Blastocatellia bacterium]